MSNITTVSTNCIPVLRLKLIENKIPLQIPMYRDPRAMSIKELREYVKNNLQAESVECQSKEMLVAKVLEDIVVRGLSNPIDPLDLDDRQPEKWLHIANLSLQKAEHIESDPIKRIDCMSVVNQYLKTLTKDRVALIKIAIGEVLFPMESELYGLLIRLGAAMMLQPMIEWEMKNLNADNDKSSIDASIMIYEMCSGFMGIPEHLTVEHAQLALGKNKKRKLSTVVVPNDGIGGGGVSVQLGSTLLMNVSEHQSIPVIWYL